MSLRKRLECYLSSIITLAPGDRLKITEDLDGKRKTLLLDPVDREIRITRVTSFDFDDLLGLKSGIGVLLGED